ncbi:YbaB/EbfC family nucleoid-associated protein [Xanthomonas perforans]|uniref:YbaB/EbfC family nucleoid-associated protein n=1 Tax=Xanthomonas perforans TaxID=442694 RepID=UPI000FFEA733|nr:YbaB/EbfC family nucleoid-associated protein [Xanthomonas perforans]MBZ2418264.1 YbaB/EbfC family nucleoid-associated protein [Xanthomonas perforans]MBZ2462249.1 YbaB/EbfC family nucleoid-associated protein [Xanthomonas perforans]MBZ2485720.1 YbaB/EbfC family nucleoid-associated protein [Xanthomonas perforans]MBZ2490404.1 YbaB/EbfC family nucleoid-associated protein [Xanthomonas perforans]MBZ2508112.1 YbaB/EbfC family nucleoid-associated protein [Xanthomonas perforans]
MRGNIAQLIQQAQKMQENLQRAQEELAKLEVIGTAGGGMVSVTLTGAKECRKVRIDPSILSDQEMAEDLIAAAFNDASNKIDAESRDRMGSATAGMQLPPGMKLPF